MASLVKRSKEEKLYGVQLDSLVDTVCFGVFPIIFGISLGYNKIYNMIVYCVYLFSGITRLGYFNIDVDNSKCFKGLPITTVSFILPIILFITKNELVIMFSFLILSFLFLYNIRINKVDLRGKKRILLLGLF